MCMQVADVIAYRASHRGDLPMYVNSLHKCLFEHMDLGVEEVAICRSRQDSYEVS